MNKRLYYFGVFILILTLVAGLLQNVLYWQLGDAIGMLESFRSWYIAYTVTLLLGMLITVRYYRYRGYYFALASFFISTIINLGQCIIFYVAISGNQTWQRYYERTVFIVLGAAAFHAISLIFSSTRQKRWLKIAGMVTLLITSAFLIILLARMNSSVAIQAILDQMAKGVEFFVVVIPFLLMLNFLDEIRMLKRKRPDFTLPEYMESVLGLTVMVLFALLLTLGLTLWSESRKLYGQTNTEETFTPPG